MVGAVATRICLLPVEAECVAVAENVARSLRSPGIGIRVCNDATPLRTGTLPRMVKLSVNVTKPVVAGWTVAVNVTGAPKGAEVNGEVIVVVVGVWQKTLKEVRQSRNARQIGVMASIYHDIFNLQ